MSNKSCQNCSHQWVCRKWGKIVDYLRYEWGGTYFIEMLKSIAELFGPKCRHYEQSQETK